MRHHHFRHSHHVFTAPDDGSGHGHHRHGPEGRQEGHHRRHRGTRHGGRMFDYGELRLLLLAMIAERPRYGYELMKAIEERFGGSYSPSPGVIYPTLAWLDDMGYATIETEQPGRKLYRITTEGEAFLAANRDAVESAQTRASHEHGREHVPAPLIRAMENLKLALRLRMKRGPIDQAAAEAIAAALDTAAQVAERS